MLILNALINGDTGWHCHETKHLPGRYECHRRLHFIDPPSPQLVQAVVAYLASTAPDWRDVNPTWQGAWGEVTATRITDRVYHFHCVLE